MVSERAKIYSKTYRIKNKAKIKAYRDANRDRQKAWREANKQKLAEYKKTPKGVRANRISNWKTNGVRGDLEFIYDHIYLPATNCEVCNKSLFERYQKCMDHDHITGEFRQILCQSCNNRDYYKRKISAANIIIRLFKQYKKIVV